MDLMAEIFGDRFRVYGVLEDSVDRGMETVVYIVYSSQWIRK